MSKLSQAYLRNLLDTSATSDSPRAYFIHLVGTSVTTLGTPQPPCIHLRHSLVLVTRRHLSPPASWPSIAHLSNLEHTSGISQPPWTYLRNLRDTTATSDSYRAYLIHLVNTSVTLGAAQQPSNYQRNTSANFSKPRALQTHLRHLGHTSVNSDLSLANLSHFVTP
jgi:hypothetical protein